MIERVAEDGAPDRLEVCGDFADPYGVLGLQRHRRNLAAELVQLPNRETSKAHAKQQQRGETAIEAAANSKVEKRHGLFLVGKAS